MKDVQLWLYVLATLAIFRPLLIAIFHDQARAFAWDDLAQVLFVGLRFDLSTAAFWVLPTFLLSPVVTLLPAAEAWLGRLRRAVGALYAAAAMFAFGADLVFFSEYNDQFNQHIFGLFHDDTTAILVTVWKSYHPIPVLAGIAALTLLNLRLLRRWLAVTPAPLGVLERLGHPVGRGFATLALFLFFAGMARGGTLWGEPILLKHAFVADDLFLNRTVINPFTALHAAVETKLAAERSGGAELFWPEGDLGAALRRVRADRGVTGAGSGDLDRDLAVTARGAPSSPPRHLFLILLESHEGWPLLPEYRQVGLSPRLADLADRGIYVRNFLPSSSGTIGSLNALVTGLPETGLNINHEAGALRPFPSALAVNFKRLGYRTRFFYGGYLGWQRLDSFAQAQGFDEVWGGGSMAKGVPTNEWGVADQYLFDFVLDTVQEGEPSFNLILTTSNHPPYDLDLDALGFPLKRLPEPLKESKSETLKVLGHLWYTDREAGRFVAETERRLSRTLFAITGDHSTRLNIGFPGGGAFEQIAVPFILYGPEVLRGARLDPRVAGSHIDIPPTLVELAAPPGFAYTTFGRDLFAKPLPAFGLGYQFIVGDGYLATDAPRPTLYPLPGEHVRPAAAPGLDEARRSFLALRALGWHRVRKGAALAE